MRADGSRAKGQPVTVKGGNATLRECFGRIRILPQSRQRKTVVAFRFCTWNVDYYDRKDAPVEDRVKLVADFDADAVALQEVRGRYTPHYEALGPSVFSKEFVPDRDTSNWMISGLVFREGTTILDKGPVPMPEREQRAVWARVKLPAGPDSITFISWHSQHGIDVTPEYKMGFFSTMSAWLAEQATPLVLGADINTWVDPVELKAADPEDPYAIEHAFVGLDPEHRLVDAYRMTLQESGRLAELLESNRDDDEPLFVSHSTTKTRRDRILISEDLRAIECDYDTQRAWEISDHALHWAVLEERAP